MAITWEQIEARKKQLEDLPLRGVADPLTPALALPELLRPCPPERVAYHPVGAAVGNVRNDGPGLVAPAASRFTT